MSTERQTAHDAEPPPASTTGDPEVRGDSSFGSKKKEGKAKLWILLGIALLAVLIFNPVGCAFLGAFVGMGQIRVTEGKLRKPQIYEPVAQTLATYCQSDPNLFPKYLSYAWLPPGLARLGDPYCSLATNYAHIEMGGGFCHYGYPT